jgi:histidinol-phosphate aminotransferase
VAESAETFPCYPAPRARVQAMKEYHPPLGSRDALRLDFNENTLACSPKVREALAQISTGALTRYPEREPVEAIVAAHLGLAARKVALTNGVDEAIHVLFETFSKPAMSSLLPVPTYTMYEVYASATDARCCPCTRRRRLAVSLRAPARGHHAAHQDHRHRQSQQPFRHVATRAQLLEIAAAPSCVVLVDEAYFHFHGETVIDLIGAGAQSHCRAHLSKAYGLAGLRLGARRSRRIDALDSPRLSPYSVNSLALACLRPRLKTRHISIGT